MKQHNTCNKNVINTIFRKIMEWAPNEYHIFILVKTLNTLRYILPTFKFCSINAWMHRSLLTAMSNCMFHQCDLKCQFKANQSDQRRFIFSFKNGFLIVLACPSCRVGIQPVQVESIILKNINLNDLPACSPIL